MADVFVCTGRNGSNCPRPDKRTEAFASRKCLMCQPVALSHPTEAVAIVSATSPDFGSSVTDALADSADVILSAASFAVDVITDIASSFDD